MLLLYSTLPLATLLISISFRVVKQRMCCSITGKKSEFLFAPARRTDADDRPELAPVNMWWSSGGGGRWESVRDCLIRDVIHVSESEGLSFAFILGLAVLVYGYLFPLSLSRFGLVYCTSKYFCGG